MKHLTLIILLAVTPLSWGDVNLTCEGHKSTRGAIQKPTKGVAVLLQNQTIPYWIKMYGKTVPVTISEDGQTYMSTDKQNALKLNRGTLIIYFSLMDWQGFGPLIFKGQCEIDPKPRI